jgi:DNA sulfur modification protein DndD
MRQQIDGNIEPVGQGSSLTTEDFFSVNQSIANLNELERSSDDSLVKELMDDIASLKAKIENLKIEIREADEAIAGYEDSDILDSRARFQNVLKQLAKAEEASEKLDERINEKKSSAESLRRKVDETDSKKSSKDTKKRLLLEGLEKVFARGLVLYRDKLKTHVEREASSLFTRLSHDPDYEKLRINDSYGLTIVHRDGAEIPIRSAGFEHIVALSLMGSLQRNAPLQGPIFMDSPMGRLDKEHKSNVISSLPDLAQQVILLIYEDEFDAEEARQILGSRLLKEYELKRVSSKHTNIETVT